MPKQGETFINAVGVEVVAHGGSTPAASEIQVPQPANQVAPDGFSFDVFGRLYENEVPAFFSTGTNMLYDRLRHPHKKAGNGGMNFALVTLKSVLAASDRLDRPLGDNEIGLPPNSFLEDNPQWGSLIFPGYGEGETPYGPEYGDQPTFGTGWTEVGYNSYSFQSPPGGNGDRLAFPEVPIDLLMDMRFTVTDYVNGDEADIRFVYSGGDLPITGPGLYTLQFQDNGLGQPMGFVPLGAEPWAFPVKVNVEDIVLRTAGPPTFLRNPILSGATDEPDQVLTVDTDGWAGADQYVWTWYRNGVEFKTGSDNTYRTVLTDSEATFRVEGIASNPNGEDGPRVSNDLVMDEYGALDSLGFDFSDPSNLFQNNDGTVPVENDGDPIGIAFGTGIAVASPTNDGVRPTWVDIGGGLGLARHVPRCRLRQLWPIPDNGSACRKDCGFEYSFVLLRVSCGCCAVEHRCVFHGGCGYRRGLERAAGYFAEHERGRRTNYSAGQPAYNLQWD